VNIFSPGVIIAATLLLLSAAPGAPLAALKAYKYEGNYSFGISLEIILVSLSVFTLPLSLGLFNRYFELNLSAHWLELSRQIFMVVVLPMIIGYSVGLLKPSWVDKYGIKAGKIVNMLLLIVSLPMIWFFRDTFLMLGVADYLMFLLFVVILFVLGHYTGGRVRSDRITLAVLCSSRHVGICLFVAVKSYERMEFLHVLVPYLIVSIVLGILYDKLTPESADQNQQLL
jgi:predicted Na+-dependent transporter